MKSQFAACSSCSFFTGCNDTREDTLAPSPFKFLVIQLDCQHNPNCYTSSLCVSHGLEIRPKLISCKSSNSYLIRATTAHCPPKQNFQLLGRFIYCHQSFVQSCSQSLGSSLFSGFCTGGNLLIQFLRFMNIIVHYTLKVNNLRKDNLWSSYIAVYEQLYKRKGNHIYSSSLLHTVMIY